MLRLISFKVTIHDEEDLDTLASLIDFLEMVIDERKG